MDLNCVRTVDSAAVFEKHKTRRGLNRKEVMGKPELPLPSLTTNKVQQASQDLLIGNDTRNLILTA